MKKFHIKKGDTVFVNAGNDKGKTGKVLEVLRDKDRVIVEGINMVDPGHAENSLLHQILHEDVVEGISMTHRDLVSEKNEQSILPLIDSWINHGAK